MTTTTKKTAKKLPGCPFPQVDVHVGEPGQLTPEEFETLAAISAAVFARRPNCVRMTLSMFLDRKNPEMQDPQRVSVLATNRCGKGTVEVVERYSPRSVEERNAKRDAERAAAGK